MSQFCNKISVDFITITLRLNYNSILKLEVSTMNELSDKESPDDKVRRRNRASPHMEQKKATYSIMDYKSHETERQELARTLHDLIGQPLTVLKLTLEQIRISPDEKRSHLISEASAVINETMAEVRKLLVSLRSNYNDLDLESTLNSLVVKYNQHTQMRVKLECAGLEENIIVPAKVTEAMFHIIQEALTNAVLYAGAKEATVRVWSNSREIIARIEDKGMGFEPGDITFTRSSLNSLYETACLVQGKLTLESAPGAGYRITVRFPLTK